MNKINDFMLSDNKDKLNKLNKYILIDKNNIHILKLGMHIKYMKNNDDKIYNGGFLINIIDKDKLFDTILILKSNIIWNLKFIKYKIYAKCLNDFNRKKKIIEDIKIEYSDEINKSKENINQKLFYKLLLIKNKKDNYKIQF